MSGPRRVMKSFQNVPGLFFVMAVGVASALPGPARAADLFLNDEPEVYEAIDKLNALGLLPGHLANTRPYSIQAVRKAAQAATGATLPGTFEGDLLRWLALYTTPKDMARLTVAGGHSDARFLPPNNQGIPRPEGWSALEGFSAREEVTPQLNGQVRAAFFQGERGDDGNRLLDASIEAGGRYFALQAGKLSTWYGPGRRGSLVLSNNAAPYPGVRLHNPEPIPLTGRAKFLGRVQYDFFVARMETKELFSRHMFVGTRLAARPAAWLEVGVDRVLHYGGAGRDNGLSEFFTDYFGSNDPSSRSNTLAGVDATLTLPFALQPVQLYIERGAEDSSHWGRIFLPWDDRFANLYGLYLPRILTIARLDLRAEYADNFSGENKGDEGYDHPAYPHLYRGALLGHAMGGLARDWFVEGRCWLMPGSHARLSWERVLQDGPAAKGERRTRYEAGLTGWLTENWRAQLDLLMDRGTSIGGVPGADRTDFSAFLSVAYQVTTISPWAGRPQ